MRIARYLPMLSLLVPVRLPAAQVEWKSAGRVVAVGDVHGDYAAFAEVLRSAGLIGPSGHWTGGKTHLVQLGDLPDRGPDTRKAMDLLMQLEKEAAKAGGRVHALIGNHEAMNMYGDLRYTTPAEFAAFVTPESEMARANFWKAEAGKSPRPTFDDRRQWESEHSLGWFEHRLQFGPDGIYGRWIRSHNAAVKIDDTLYVHAGIAPRFVSMPLKQIDETIAAQLSDFLSLDRDGPVIADDGPLWYRGLAELDGPGIAAHVDRILAAYGVKRIVVGHTPTAGAVIPRFEGKVILADVGMSAVYGGHRACLLLEGGSLYAIHRGQKLALPLDGAAGLVEYLKKAAALEPPDSSLVEYAAETEAKLTAAK